MADPTLRRTMRYVESARMEEASKLQAATDKGREEQGKRSALSLRDKLPEEVIAESLGFPLNTIRAWYAEVDKEKKKTV